MALSKCGFCGSTSFELMQTSPRSSRFKLYFVQCASCGAPVGVQEYENTGAKLSALDEKVGKLEQQLDGLRHDIRIIAAALDRR